MDDSNLDNYGVYFEESDYDDFFNFIKRDNAIIIELKKNNNLLISSWLNGGYQENMKYVVNQSLTKYDYPIIESMNYQSFQEKRMNELGLNVDKSTGLITSACMDNYAISTAKYKQLKVTSIITAGADKNGAKAGDSASFYEYNNNYDLNIGTINIITIIDANLNKEALVTGLITLTEAKTSVLQDLKLESQYSTSIATGTGTDGVCLISNKSSNNHLENAGKHSKLGELIAKTVQDALRKALYLQTAMSREYQKTVLSRLSRFNIDFDVFYENTKNISRNDYASLFYQFNNDTKVISWISSIINLVDEVQSGLLELSDVEQVICEMVNNFLNKNEFRTFKSIDDILNYLIKSINEHLLS